MCSNWESDKGNNKREMSMKDGLYWDGDYNTRRQSRREILGKSNDNEG